MDSPSVYLSLAVLPVAETRTCGVCWAGVSAACGAIQFHIHWQENAQISGLFLLHTFHMPQKFALSRELCRPHASLHSFQISQMQYKDSRLKLMNQILTGIKVRWRTERLKRNSACPGSEESFRGVQTCLCTSLLFSTFMSLELNKSGKICRYWSCTLGNLTTLSPSWRWETRRSTNWGKLPCSTPCNTWSHFLPPSWYGVRSNEKLEFNLEKTLRKVVLKQVGEVRSSPCTFLKRLPKQATMMQHKGVGREAGTCWMVSRGESISLFSGGHVLQTFIRGSTSHPQSLCTASCLYFWLPFWLLAVSDRSGVLRGVHVVGSHHHPGHRVCVHLAAAAAQCAHHPHPHGHHEPHPGPRLHEARQRLPAAGGDQHWRRGTRLQCPLVHPQTEFETHFMIGHVPSGPVHTGHDASLRAIPVLLLVSCVNTSFRAAGSICLRLRLTSSVGPQETVCQRHRLVNIRSEDSWWPKTYLGRCGFSHFLNRTLISNHLDPPFNKNACLSLSAGAVHIENGFFSWGEEGRMTLKK